MPPKEDLKTIIMKSGKTVHEMKVTTFEQLIDLSRYVMDKGKRNDLYLVRNPKVVSRYALTVETGGPPRSCDTHTATTIMFVKDDFLYLNEGDYFLTKLEEFLNGKSTHCHLCMEEPHTKGTVLVGCNKCSYYMCGECTKQQKICPQCKAEIYISKDK